MYVCEKTLPDFWIKPRILRWAVAPQRQTIQSFSYYIFWQKSFNNVFRILEQHQYLKLYRLHSNLPYILRSMVYLACQWQKEEKYWSTNHRTFDPTPSITYNNTLIIMSILLLPMSHHTSFWEETTTYVPAIHRLTSAMRKSHFDFNFSAQKSSLSINDVNDRWWLSGIISRNYWVLSSSSWVRSVLNNCDRQILYGHSLVNFDTGGRWLIGVVRMFYCT